MGRVLRTIYPKHGKSILDVGCLLHLTRSTSTDMMDCDLGMHPM